MSRAVGGRGTHPEARHVFVSRRFLRLVSSGSTSSVRHRHYESRSTDSTHRGSASCVIDGTRGFSHEKCICKGVSSPLNAIPGLLLIHDVAYNERTTTCMAIEICAAVAAIQQGARSMNYYTGGGLLFGLQAISEATNSANSLIVSA